MRTVVWVFAALIAVSASTAALQLLPDQVGALAGGPPNQFDNADDDEAFQNDYSENAIEDLLQNAAQKRSRYVRIYRRSCIRRGGNCDHQPNDCCYNSSCRCNLWGSNCRCQRMGLFQKWG